MNADSVMDNIRNAFERSGMTLNELGEGLGYDGPIAKKRAWFLLYRTSDPCKYPVVSFLCLRFFVLDRYSRKQTHNLRKLTADYLFRQCSPLPMRWGAR